MRSKRKIIVGLLLICCLVVSSMPVSVQAKSKTKYTVDYVASKTYNNRWGIKKVTKEEVRCLARIVYLEARGEGDKGEQAVIETILNRVAHKKFPNKITKVLSQKNQFTTWRKRFNAPVREKELKNIYKVLNGKTSVVSKKVVFFSTRPYNRKIELHYKHHYFCRY